MPIIVFKNGKASTKDTSGAQYSGEKIPGDLENWNVLSSDSNYILESTYGDLSSRSMTLFHTHPFCKGAITKQTEYSVGGGLAFRSQPDWSTLGKTKEWGKDWGKEFQKIVHYYFQEFGLYGKQSVLMRGALASGGSILDFERDSNGYLTDLIDVGNNQIDWQQSTGDYYLGIKADKMNRGTGLFLRNGEKPSYVDANGNQNLVHFFIKELPEQLRGYPMLYSIINHAKQDDRHTDAIVQRAVMEAIMWASKEGNETDMSAQFDDLNKRTQENTIGGKITSAVAKMWGSKGQSPGAVLQLGQGEKWNVHDIKTPSNNYDPFKHWNLRYVAGGTGTPPEVILSEYSTSFTAHKGALNDFEKSYMFKRRMFADTVMYPVIKEIAKDAIMQGFIKAPGFFDGAFMIQRAYLQGMYLGPVPGHINPLQEVQANIKAVDAAFKLRSDVASMNGNEWDNFLTEWQEESMEYAKYSPEARAAAIQTQEMEAGSDG
jgi:hypothetical protein